jgi:hypothetical protein
VSGLRQICTRGGALESQKDDFHFLGESCDGLVARVYVAGGEKKLINKLGREVHETAGNAENEGKRGKSSENRENQEMRKIRKRSLELGNLEN